MLLEQVLFIIFISLSYTFISHFISAFIVYCINENFPFLYTPATFYKLTEMNWVGCIITYILLFPIAFISEIGGFLKWLFTVGRKD